MGGLAAMGRFHFRAAGGKISVSVSARIECRGASPWNSLRNRCYCKYFYADKGVEKGESGRFSIDFLPRGLKRRLISDGKT